MKFSRPVFIILFSCLNALFINAEAINNLSRVESYLSDQGISFQERNLFADLGGFGTSLYIDLPATTENSTSTRSLVIACPFDDRAVQENLSFGIRSALALALRANKEPRLLNLRIALLANEKSELPKAIRGSILRGSRDLAGQFEDTDRVLIVYLDLENENTALSLVHGSAKNVVPLYYLKSLLQSFAEKGHFLSPELPFNELYRLALIQGPEELRIFNEYGFSSLLIKESKKLQTKAEHISSDDFSGILSGFITKINTMEEAEDRHYSLFSFGNLTISLSEGLSIALFGLAASLGLLYLFIYSLSHRHLLLARTKLFLRRLWVIPFFLLILFICIRLSAVLFDLLLRIAKAPPKSDEYAAVTLTFLHVFSLYFLLSPLFSRKPFPRRAHYFGSAAVLLLAVGTFIAAILDFTFVPIFLWSFSLALLAAIIPQAQFVAIFSALAPLELVLSALACIGSGDSNPARLMLSGNYAIELVLAFLLLPFIFLFTRTYLLFSSFIKPSRRLRPVSFSHYLPRLLFFFGIVLASLSYARSVPIIHHDEMGIAAVPLAASIHSKNFLDQKTITFNIKADEAPLRYDVSLISTGAFVLYDTPTQAIQSTDSKSLVFDLGERPRNPLELYVTVPAAFTGELKIHAIFEDKEKSGAFLAGSLEKSIGLDTNESK